MIVGLNERNQQLSKQPMHIFIIFYVGILDLEFVFSLAMHKIYIINCYSMYEILVTFFLLLLIAVFFFLSNN